MTNFETLKHKMEGDKTSVPRYIRMAYNNSVDHKMETLTFDELPWGRHVVIELKEMVEFLKNLGIKEFWVCERSTALSEALVYLMQNGVTITGGEIYKMPSIFGSHFTNDVPVLKCQIK